MIYVDQMMKHHKKLGRLLLFSTNKSSLSYYQLLVLSTPGAASVLKTKSPEGVSFLVAWLTRVFGKCAETLVNSL